MRSIYTLSSLSVVLAVLLPFPAPAHHSFAAEFDARAPVSLKGKVTKIEWINPHAWVHLDVVKEDESVVSWMVEGGTPNPLLRRGLTRDTIPIGAVVVVDGYQSKDRSARANGRDVTFEDGRKFFMGSSGTGAPLDGRDATEPE